MHTEASQIFLQSHMSTASKSQGDGLSIMYFRPVGVGMGMRPHHSLGLRVSGMLRGGQWVWDVCRSLSGEWYWIESGSVPGVNWSTWWLQEKGNGRKKCFSAYITFLSDSVVQC